MQRKVSTIREGLLSMPHLLLIHSNQPLRIIYFVLFISTYCSDIANEDFNDDVIFKVQSLLDFH